jgi:hypothetical protein
MQFDTPDEATQMARYLAAKCAGVLAWVRDAQREAGGYGPLTILFQSGDVPELE